MSEIFLDLETKSEIDLNASGQWRYSQGEATDIIVMYYSNDGAAPLRWVPGDPVPACFNTADKYFARSALFEYALTCNVLIPKYKFPDRMKDLSFWHCTAAACRVAGLPGSLEKSAAALRVPQQKKPEGKALIKKYSVPVKEDKKNLFEEGQGYHFRSIPPEDFKLFAEYCKADVIADIQCWQKVKPLKNHALERTNFLIDFAQNTRGLRVDTAALNKFLKCYDKIMQRVDTEAAALQINPGSPKQVVDYCKSKGYKMEGASAAEVERIKTRAKMAGDDKTIKILELRQFKARSSVKKFKALADKVCEDGRLRDFLRYYGAGTGRWSGSGFQPHNLPKTKTTPDDIDNAIKGLSPDMSYNEIIDAGQTILPGLIIPNKDNTFLMGDFSAVEARGIALLAGQLDLVHDFKKDIDVYITMGAEITKKPVKEITKESEARTVGKVGILSCGYGAGIKGITGMLSNYGLYASEDLAISIVNTYRARYKKIVSFWRELEKAFTYCIGREGLTQRVGDYIKLTGRRGYIIITLPNGRELFYHKVMIDKDGASYWNYGQDRRVKLWGGLLAENITQAVCRDILADRMGACVNAGLLPILHVHDEIIIETPLDKVEEQQQTFEKIMNTAPAWLPAFPLKTEIEISRRYHK